MKIIHITDTHLCASGNVRGLDTNARFAAVMDDVNARHCDADLVVVTGDLVDDGRADSYDVFATMIERLRVPYRLLLGNHDKRDAFRARFSTHPVDDNGFVQSSVDAPGRQGRLLFLDSAEPGWIGGRYCERRLQWLQTQLNEAGDRPAIVFLHHPPLPFGVPYFENICIHDPDPLTSCLRRYRGGVRHLFFGHIHLPLSGVYPGGIPFTAGRGCAHQVMLDFDRLDVNWAADVPGYNIIDLREDAMFVHSYDLIESPAIAHGDICDGP